VSNAVSENEKRRLILKYFKKFPKWAIKLLLVGLLISTFHLIGFLMIASSLLVIGWWMKKPTDAEMDTWTDEDLALLKGRALEKSGLHESELIRDSVMVVSPRFWLIGGAAVGIKKGRDNIVRYIPVGATVIQFTEHQLVTYQCALDLTTGNFLSESVDEYFYVDIVNVSTRSRSMTIDESTISNKFMNANPLIKKHVVNGKLQLNAAEVFELTTTGGNSVSVMLREPTLLDSSGGGELPTYLADQAVHAVRQMVKSKKFQTA
jgi:hypothetical protein